LIRLIAKVDSIASPKARYVTGQCLPADGGVTARSPIKPGPVLTTEATAMNTH
jgi:NAD(P)-dependent dehydrogenase (short-subunit alcohol dehydrogenase family)